MSGRSALLAALLGLLSPPGPTQKESAPREVKRERLKVTQGELESAGSGRLHIEEPKVRAVVSSVEAAGRRAAASPVRVAELRFTYLGVTREQVPLKSGEMRRQVGLKLRAQDGCNVVYVMWRLAPKAGLVVSMKHNPGKHRYAECGNGGYRTVRPSRKASVPVLAEGSSHVLRAELRDTELKVQVDGEQVWEGTLPAEVLTFDGPMGLRSDNGRFDLELLTR